MHNGFWGKSENRRSGMVIREGQMGNKSLFEAVLSFFKGIRDKFCKTCKK